MDDKCDMGLWCGFGAKYDVLKVLKLVARNWSDVSLCDVGLYRYYSEGDVWMLRFSLKINQSILSGGMSERGVERDERGREIVYVSGKDLPTKHEWTKHMNNLVERGQIEKAMNVARDMMNLGIEPDVITLRF